MQKVMSTRIDESVLALIDKIAREKKLSKKTIIEEAIKDFWEKTHNEKEIDLFQSSFGAWKRDESVDETVHRSRKAFNQSMHRHHKNEKD